MIPQFSYEIHTERIFGNDKVKREIFISVSDHPKMENDTLEYLTVEDVKTIRDMCDQILKEVKNDEEKHEAAGKE